jgi:hypothetical protein
MNARYSAKQTTLEHRLALSAGDKRVAGWCALFGTAIDAAYSHALAGDYERNT